MIRRPPRSTRKESSAASDVYKRQGKMSISGRPNNFPAGEWLLDQAHRLSVQDKPPQPFLKGRHLIEMGIKPGPEIGKLLKQAFDVQINGEIRSLNEAMKWVESSYLIRQRLEKKEIWMLKQRIT